MKIDKALPIFIPTLNNMGYMTTYLDSVSEEFIRFSGQCQHRVLEIGAAYGIATKAALTAGATIVCNDLCPQHLEFLLSEIPIEKQKKLELVPGDFPDEVSFSPNYFGGILLSRVLHLFDGEKIERAIKRSYEYLKPGGKIFIIADTPYLSNVRNFIPVFEQRKNNNEAWPGVILDVKNYFTGNLEHFPSFVNLLDDEILSRVLLKNNFKIEWVGFLERKDYPEDRQLDGRESVGAIAYK